MKLRFTLPLLLLATMAAQDKPAPPPPVPAAPPTLTSDQKVQLADALTNLIEAQSELEHLPGYADYTGKVQAAKQIFAQLQASACKSANGKQYQLDRSTDPATGKVVWSCKELPAPAKK
jgi:hypothetical protein